MADECVRNMDGMKLENLEISVEIARRWLVYTYLSVYVAVCSGIYYQVL